MTKRLLKSTRRPATLTTSPARRLHAGKECKKSRRGDATSLAHQSLRQQLAFYKHLVGSMTTTRSHWRIGPLDSTCRTQSLASADPFDLNKRPGLRQPRRVRQAGGASARSALRLKVSTRDICAWPRPIAVHPTTGLRSFLGGRLAVDLKRRNRWHSRRRQRQPVAYPGYHQGPRLQSNGPTTPQLGLNLPARGQPI